MRETAKLSTDNISSLVATGAGFDLLRYYTLPDFLGKDALIFYIIWAKTSPAKLTFQHGKNSTNSFNTWGGESSHL
ncbi:YslB family protein [Halobacillus shinanisalinarum]|uniref:YslB family protein n=1 Tax=Halobacillus shinanisalinarum TaxID=2932258 RepID=A0ABY4H5Q5_9BACI|nr:YslB family protein [Halobacillus shinanisalinarum]UOQ95801.1 YslB family protein [Halobacillus shinanisalinarum]